MQLRRGFSSSILMLFGTFFFVFTCLSGVLTAQTPSTTALAVSAACPKSGCVVTLTATVTANSAAAHPGLVVFCDGGTTNCQYRAPLGQAQLLTNGTATIRLSLSPGTHSLRAIFSGTKAFGGSTSSTQSLTVSPTSVQRSTVATIAVAGVDGGDKLSSTVTGLGTRSPSGAVAFVDISNSFSVLATASLGPGVTSFNYLSGGFDLSKVPASVLTDVNHVVTGDFNNDGFEDALLVNSSESLGILLGNGKGGFTYKSIPNALSNGSPLIADFNGDGNLDIVTQASGGNLAAYLGNGDGSFQQVVQSASNPSGNCTAVGDFNKDGIPDLVCEQSTLPTGNEELVLLGNGDGSFTAASDVKIEEDYLTQVQVADFDRDGNPDILALDRSEGDLYLFRGKGDGTFTRETYLGVYTTTLLVADFDGDGIPDFVTLNSDSFTIFHGNGDGSFSKGDPKQLTGTGGADEFATLQGIWLGDFNGDGKIDIEIGFLDNESDPNPSILRTFLNNGDGSFTAGPSITTQQESPILATADFTGDNIPDVISFNTFDEVPPSTFAGALLTTAMASTPTGIVIPGTGPHSVDAKYPGDSYFYSSLSTLVGLAGTVDYSSGFSGGQTPVLNGSASLLGNAIKLTDGGKLEAGSFFFPTRVPVATFSTSFDFQLTNAVADGFAFVIQSNGPNALGSPGGGLGYGNPPDNVGQSIPNSVAIAFDLHNNQGEGNNSVRLEFNGQTSAKFNGAYPSNATDLTPSGIDLHSGHRFHAEIDYSGAYLSLKITDLQTGRVFSGELPAAETPVSLLGGFAYVGFTGATGENTATETIFDWRFTPTRSEINTYAAPEYPTGFAGATWMHLNRGSAISGSAIQLTHGTAFEATSAYFQLPVKPQTSPYASNFITDFDFQIEGGVGDGFTFVLQNQGINDVGASGGGLGYGPDKPGGAGYKLGKSLAIKFDLYNNAGEGVDSTGLYVNGASPTTPSIDLTATGINLHSGHVFHARISNVTQGFYSYVVLQLTDLTVFKVYSTTFMIPSTSVPPIGYAGFTAGTGKTSSDIKILNWTWTED